MLKPDSSLCISIWCFTGTGQVFPTLNSVLWLLPVISPYFQLFYFTYVHASYSIPRLMHVVVSASTINCEFKSCEMPFSYLMSKNSIWACDGWRGRVHSFHLLLSHSLSSARLRTLHMLCGTLQKCLLIIPFWHTNFSAEWIYTRAQFLKHIRGKSTLYLTV